MRRALERVGPPLAALAAAVGSWAIVAALFVDALGVGRSEPAAAGGAPSDDPCVLRQALTAGTDALCVFELSRSAGRPLLVDLDQRWTGNVLSQWLNVRPSGSAESLLFVYAQTSGASAARLLRVFAVHGPAGDDHLGYLIGRCGAPACPVSDLVVVGEDGGRFRTLLTARLGPLADVRLHEEGLTSVEGWFPPGATAPGGMVARRFAWNGSAYALRELSMVLPSPSPSPR